MRSGRGIFCASELLLSPLSMVYLIYVWDPVCTGIQLLSVQVALTPSLYLAFSWCTASVWSCTVRRRRLHIDSCRNRTLPRVRDN